jgi:DNA-binding MltR family transcriptional regulator
MVQDDKDNHSTSSNITGKSLERYFELNDALFHFSKLFDYDEKNDRAIVIVGATFLDTILEHILRAFLIDNEKEVNKLLQCDQPLGTFSGKITMAYCLGLIYKPVQEDLNLVRKIRNEFAHNLYASFEDEKIKAWCLSLKWHRFTCMAEPPKDATARDLFQVGTNQLVCYLNGVVGVARTQKCQVDRHFEKDKGN